jgi:hypothetical protein
MPWIDQQGYVRVWHQGRETRQHRVVAAEMLGRSLLSTEHVHHRNGVKSDNRPENLEVVDGRSHLLEHWQEGHYDPRVQRQQVPERPCSACGEVARIHGQEMCRRCYMRGAMRKYTEQNREKVRERQRQYRAANREAIAARKRARRAQGKAG